MTKIYLTLLTIVLFFSISNAFQIRRLAWDDPYCNTFDSTGNCTKCSYKYYFNENHVCTPISDFCSAWNSTTGVCTACYDGYVIESGTCVVPGSSSGNETNNQNNTNTENNTNSENNTNTDPNCAEFDVNGACVQCYYRYYVDSATGVCLKISD
jgi:hypothetical protein